MSRNAPNGMARHLILSDEISQSSVSAIIEKILAINEDDREKEATYVGYKAEPIYLFLNTNGGVIYDALALVDVIKTSVTKIYTVALGWTMSAGLLIFVNGHKRLIGPNATLMYHDVSGWVSDKTQGIINEVNEMSRLSELFVKHITENSIVEEEDLNSYIACKSEWYIPADEAIEYGLADGYYKLKE